jgi:hypothetical protein
MKTNKHRTLLSLIAAIMVLSLVLVPVASIHAQEPQRPDPATPFDGGAVSGKGSTTSSTGLPRMSRTSGSSTFQNGADRLAALQNSDGGWGWPLSGTSALNTIGPIANGLGEAFYHTIDPVHRAALLKAGTLLLTKLGTFSPSDGYLAALLDQIFGGTKYTDYVKVHFYNLLAAGTYFRSGDSTAYNTAAYVERIRTVRSGSQANMAAWDIGIGLVGAASVGADTAPWIDGVKAEINELDSSNYYDVLGLAGAIYGLAFVHEDFDPTAGSLATDDNLADLGITLASYQIPSSGGFAWNSAYVNNGGETNQETAYAILALNQLDRASYLANIQAATNYLAGVQLATGGWNNYAGDVDENNEITGEALWALTTSPDASGYPLGEIYVCPSGDCGHPGTSTNSIQAAIDAIGHSVIYLDAGTYNQTDTILVNKPVTIIGPAGGGAIVQGTNSAAVSVFEISASNVTIQNLTITHNALPAFVSAGWLELPNSLIRIPASLGLTGVSILDNFIYVPTQSGAMSTWNGVGITVGSTTSTDFSIIGNTIHNVRDGVVVQYNNIGTISNNTIYNTKGGIMNYTGTQADADNRTMSNNAWGTVHNEWDIVWNSGGGPYDQDYHKDVLLLAAANNGAYIVSRMTASATQPTLVGNRSVVFVNTLTGTLTKSSTNGNINLPYATVALGNEAIVAGGTVYVSTALPPIPSDFYGYLHFNDVPPSLGDMVEAYVPGVALPIATGAIITDPDTVSLAYQIDVPGDLSDTPGKEGGVEGDTVTFMIAGRVVATGVWHGGTNVRLDFHPPQALPGGPYNGLVDAPISLSGLANDAGSDVATYSWDLDNNGSFETPGQNVSNHWPTVGTKTIGLQVTDANGGVGKDTATVNIASITLGSLNPTYDGSAKAATATTDPVGLMVDFTYDGSSTAPSAAGSYAVVATIASYTGSVTGTLHIAQATSSVTVDCPLTAQTYTGSPLTPCTASYSGAGGLTGSLTPSYSNNVNVGTATASATYLGDANHTGSSNSATFTISAATASITLGNLNPVWDGLPQSVTYITDPPNLAVSVTYNGSPAHPVDPGSYTVVATITDPNYTGSATATMYIQSTHTIDLVPGWNLVSFNLHPMNTSIAAVLNSLDNDYDLVYGWDATGGHSGSGNWVKFAPGGPAYANSLTNLDETMGFWIHMSSARTLNLVGNAVFTSSISMTTTAGGWNLVGYPSASSSADVATPLGSHVNLVYAYHAGEADLWKIYDPLAPPFANDLHYLSPGYGYWVKVPSAFTWNVGY